MITTLNPLREIIYKHFGEKPPVQLNAFIEDLRSEIKDQFFENPADEETLWYDHLQRCQQIAKIGSWEGILVSGIFDLRRMDVVLPDIILLDINMPVMNGFDFLEQFTQLSGNLKDCCRIYILTSSIYPEEREKAFSYKEVNGFINKPLTADKLEMLN